MQKTSRGIFIICSVMTSLANQSAKAADLGSILAPLGQPYEQTVSGHLIVGFSAVPSGNRLILNNISCSIAAGPIQAQQSILAWGKSFPGYTHIVYLPQTPVYGSLDTGHSTTTPTSYVVNLSFLGFVNAGETPFVQVETYRLLQPDLTCTLSGFLVPA